MTDHQKEIAARELCRLRGLDPDHPVPHGAVPNEYGVTQAVILHSPRWRLALPEIEAHLQVKAAIDFASEQWGVGA